MFKYLSLFFLIIISMFLITSPAMALDSLVPCGNEGQPLCTTCDFLVLGKNISDFILVYLVPAIAALLFVYAGFEILLGGGIPARVAKGRAVFQTTAYGLLIIFTAWLIVNTVLRTVAGDDNISQNWWKLECKESVVTAGNNDNSGELPPNVDNGDGDDSTDDLPPVAIDPASNPSTVTSALVIITSSLPDGKVGEDYNKTLIANGGNSPYVWSKSAGNLSVGLTLSTVGVISGRPTTAGFSIFTVKVEDSSTPKKLATKQLSIQLTNNSVSSAALVCKYSGVNLCQPNTTLSSTFCGFSSSSCSKFSEAIQKAASKVSISGLNSSALIKSFIVNESSCNINAVNSIKDPATGVVRESCGPMQMQVATANTLKPACGITASITCGWLRDPVNLEGIVCLGAQYIKSIAGGTCGTKIQNIAAGYNGGVGACGASNDCKNDKSCDGGTVKRWECLYDSQPAPLHCNTGYDETRAYAPKVLACYNANK